LRGQDFTNKVAFIIMAYLSQPIISGLQCVGLTAPAIYTGTDRVQDIDHYL
jgi:hypothetical protein